MPLAVVVEVVGIVLVRAAGELQTGRGQPLAVFQLQGFVRDLDYLLWRLLPLSASILAWSRNRWLMTTWSFRPEAPRLGSSVVAEASGLPGDPVRGLFYSTGQSGPAPLVIFTSLYLACPPQAPDQARG